MRWRLCSELVPIGDRLVGRSSGQVKGLGLDIYLMQGCGSGGLGVDRYIRNEGIHSTIDD